MLGKGRREMKGDKNIVFDVHRFFDAQPDVDQRTIALHCIERLMQLEEIWYRRGGTEFDGSKVEESLYWKSCGEDLRVPF